MRRTSRGADAAALGTTGAGAGLSPAGRGILPPPCPSAGSGTRSSAEASPGGFLTRAVTGRSATTLPVWELVVSLRPAGAVSLWASDMAAHGRPDVTADTMRADQHAYVDDALERLAGP